MNKKKLRNFLIVFVAVIVVFTLLLLTGILRDFYSMFFPEKEIRLNGDLSRFSTDKYKNVSAIDVVAEYGDNIYYINPKDKTLYRYIEQGKDEQVCASQMKYMLISDKSIYYTEKKALFVQPLEGGDVREISKLGSVSGDAHAAGCKLFFLNENFRMCSYDTGTKELKILSSHKAYTFQLYSDHIMYKSDDEIYGIDVDGSDEVLMVRTSGNFAVEDDYMFIVTDCCGTDFDYTLFRVDFKNNRLAQLTHDTTIKPLGFQIVNNKLYFYENGSYTQADLNCENTRKIDNLWGAKSLGTGYCLIIRDNGNSCITMYNENDEQINEVFLEGFNVSEIVSVGAYIVVIGDEDTGILFFDKDFNQIDSIK